MKRTLRLLLPAAASLVLAGCPAESPAPPPAASAAPVADPSPTPGVRPAASARAVASEAPASAAAPAAAASPAAPTAAAPPTPPPGALDREALDALLTQAAAAPGGTDCEKAYAGMQVLVQALSQRLGRPAPPAPDRAPFLAACGDLAPEAQRCMVLDYNRDHREECTAAMAAVPPEKMARLRSVSRPAQ